MARTKASIEAAGVVGDHREADAARTGVEIFRVIASRFGPMGVAFNHLDSADDEDFAGVAGLENVSSSRKGISAAYRFRRCFEKFAIRINHRAPQLLRQQPSRSVGEAELMRPVLNNSDLFSRLLDFNESHNCAPPVS